MNIYIANESKQNIGGGWTFIGNFTKGVNKIDGIYFVDNWQECDIYFIAGCTMITRSEVEEAKKAGKKIVLRIDNIPRNSRNRNTGTSRLYDYAQMADAIVYQSKWAQNLISGFIKDSNKKTKLIYNGVDTTIFNTGGIFDIPDGKPQYLYSRFGRDESKMWVAAWYKFQRKALKDENAHLWIVGQFSDELQEYNFDFFGGAEKRYKYKGIVGNKREMAEIYRSADILLAPYYNDACSNTILEAVACGCEIDLMRPGRSGGSPELLKLEDISLERMAKQYVDLFKKL